MTGSMVAAYEQLLVDNVSTVRTVESAIRNVTWFLPGRFDDADIASEGLYALLSVVSSVHDALLAKRIPPSLSLPPHPFAEPVASSSTSGSGSPKRITPALPPPSEHSRYTKYWTKNSNGYRRASRALATTTYIELLIEMVARKRVGDRARWRLVLSIESIKTILRLILLAITRRPVIYPPTPQREYDVGDIPADLLDKHGTTVLPPMSSETDDRSNPVITALGKRAPLRSHLYPLVASLPDTHREHPLSLVPELRSVSAYTAEVLAASATLVQVILLIRSSRKQTAPAYRPASLPTVSRALSPFLVPLVLQLIARRLRPPAGESVLLADHYAHLDRKLASKFFLQGPMWIGWTRPKVVTIVKALERIPLIGLVGELMEGYIPLVDDYFYTTS